MYYYTCHCRSNPMIILCDALILKSTFNACYSLLISSGTSFLEVVARCRNHMMHCLNGNTNQTTPPVILSLDSLISSEQSTQSQNNNLPIFKLSRNFLLEHRPPSKVHTPSELCNILPTLRPRPSFRKGLGGSTYFSGTNVKHWYHRKKFRPFKDLRPIRHPSTPPPGGTPGVASATNKECSPRSLPMSSPT